MENTALSLAQKGLSNAIFRRRSLSDFVELRLRFCHTFEHTTVSNFVELQNLSVLGKHKRRRILSKSIYIFALPWYNSSIGSIIYS